MLKSKWFVCTVLTLSASSAFAATAESRELASRPASRNAASRTEAPARASSEDAEAELGSRSSLPVALARPNAFSIELLGRGVLYGINYDRSVTENIGLGVGFSYISSSIFSSGSDSASVMIIPVYSNFYFSPGTSRAFATAGVDIGIAKSSGGTQTVHNPDGTIYGTTNAKGSSSGGVLVVAGFGYEYRATEGFLFRAAPYLLVGGGSVLPWLGLSAGATF